MAAPRPPAVAPQGLHWSQLGVGYVGMQPFMQSMVNGGLSGFMRGVIPGGFRRILPDIGTDLANSETVGCEVSVKVVGVDLPGFGPGPSGSVAGGFASVQFKVKGTVQPECVKAIITVDVRIVAIFVDASGEEHREVLDEKEVGRITVGAGGDYDSGVESASFDRGEALKSKGEIERDDYTFKEGWTKLEIVATIADSCGCVADDAYVALWPEFFDYQEGRDANDRPIRVPFEDLTALSEVPGFSSGDRLEKPCDIEIEIAGHLLASEPTRKDGRVQGSDVTGLLAIRVRLSSDCTPGQVTVLLQSAMGSLLGVVISKDGKDVFLPLGDGSVDPSEVTVAGTSAEMGLTVTFPIGSVDAAVRRIAGEAGVKSAYETMRGQASIRVTDDCGCVKTKSVIFGPKRGGK